MVLVDLRLPPVGHLVRFAVPGPEGGALLLHEDHERLPVGGAVGAPPCHRDAPVAGLLAQLGDITELGALEEALAHVGDVALDARFVAGMAHARRVGEEAAVLGVVEEAPGRARMEGVGPGHRRREIVDDG